jgi:hypothetical protein
MKVFFFSIISILSFIQVNDWNRFESEKGNFSVLVPGKMTQKKDTVETEIGNLTYHIYFHKPELEDADNFLYMVSYCDYPEGTVHSDSTELLAEFFEATVESSTFSVNGELYYSSDIEYRGYPGKIWRVNYGDNTAAIKTKAFVIGNRYYAIQAITLRDKSLNAAIDKFLDSFQLLE